MRKANIELLRIVAMLMVLTLHYLGQVFFYFISIYLLFLLTGRVKLRAQDVVSAICPVVSRQWSFVTDYMGIYLLSPFLNAAIKAMSKK